MHGAHDARRRVLAGEKCTTAHTCSLSMHSETSTGCTPICRASSPIKTTARTLLLLLSLSSPFVAVLPVAPFAWRSLCARVKSMRGEPCSLGVCSLTITGFVSAFCQTHRVINTREQLCNRYCSNKHTHRVVTFTQYSSPPRSLVRDGQTSSHRPRLVVSRSTCPPFSPP